MSSSRETAPACAYLLADHLDAILAIGEDVLARRFLVGRTTTPPETAGNLTEFVAALRADEMLLAAHLRQARLRAAEIARDDVAFASLVRLFIGGTARLSDLLVQMTNPALAGFDDGNEPVAYLHSRGVIDAEAAGPKPGQEIVPGDDFKIAGSIELGPILDLAAAFLDSLDIAYDLYPTRPMMSDGGASADGHAHP